MKIVNKTRIWIFGITIIALLLLSIMMAGYIRVVLPASQSEKYFLKNTQKDKEVEIEDLGNDFYQIIKVKDETLEKIEIPVYCLKEDKNSKIEVIVSDGNHEIQSQLFAFDDEDTTSFVIELDNPYYLDNSSELIVSFHTEDYVKGTGAFGQAYWNVAQTEFYMSGEKQDFDLTMLAAGGTCSYLIPMFWIIFSVLFATYILLCCFLLRNHWNYSKVFVLIAGSIGILYTFFWSPYACPDEYQHINTAYYYSSCILGEKGINEAGETLFRETDMTYAQGEIQTNKYSYYLISKNLFSKPDADSVQNKSSMRWWPMRNVTPLCYLPQILVITIVRFIEGGNLLWLFGGRLSALIVYLLSGYWALKKIPFGKMPLLILMLGPTAIQEAASFSYDSMLNSCVFLFIAFSLYFVYEKTKTKIRWYELLLLFAAGFVFVSTKVVYFPVLFIILMIPSHKISVFKWKANLSKFVLISMNAVLGIVVRASQIQLMAASNTDAYSGIEGYTLFGMLSNPLKIIVLWANTIRERTVYYIQQVFGGYEIYSKVSISWLVILGFWILIVLALIVKESDKIIDTTGRIVLIFVSLMSLGCIVVAFNLAKDCTTLTSSCVFGIQGRYFLPFLPLLFIALQNKKIVVRESIEKQILIAAYCMEVLAMCGIFETIVSR